MVAVLVLRVLVLVLNLNGDCATRYLRMTPETIERDVALIVELMVVVMRMTSMRRMYANWALRHRRRLFRSRRLDSHF